MFPVQIAVITGDLVGSTDFETDKVEAAMRALAGSADRIAAWSQQSDSRFTRFRGDGWQLYLEWPHLCLRAALVLTASARAVGHGPLSRVSIAIGPADNLGTRDLSDASGPAFQRSGRGLDAMPKSARIVLSGESLKERDQIIARLMFERTSRWTQPQAEAMALYLHPDNPTLQDIGAALGISAQAANYRLGGGGAGNLRATLQLWEDLMERETDTPNA
jgi:hypothetical protein